MDDNRYKSVTQVDELKHELKEKRLEITRLQGEAENISRHIRILYEHLSVENSGPSISDHAVVRYLERHFEFNITTVRKEILDSFIIPIDSKIDGDYRLKTGCVAVVKNGVALTIMEKSK